MPQQHQPIPSPQTPAIHYLTSPCHCLSIYAPHACYNRGPARLLILCNTSPSNLLQASSDTEQTSVAFMQILKSCTALPGPAHLGSIS